jgi:hypothetical protein
MGSRPRPVSAYAISRLTETPPGSPEPDANQLAVARETKCGRNNHWISRVTRPVEPIDPHQLRVLAEETSFPTVFHSFTSARMTLRPARHEVNLFG